MAYGNLNVDTITGSGASSVIVNNGSANVAGFTTGNNLQMLQNGGGIVFSNSSATTNSTLNDYETGTYTPTLSFSVSGSVSYSLNLGSYTKIGNLVTVTAFFVLSGVSSPSGNTTFSLPFNTNSANGYLGSGSCAPYNLATGAYAVTVENTSSNSFYIWNFANGTRSSIASYLTSSSQLHITVTYVATF